MPKFSEFNNVCLFSASHVGSNPKKHNEKCSPRYCLSRELRNFVQLRKTHQDHPRSVSPISICPKSVSNFALPHPSLPNRKHKKTHQQKHIKIHTPFFPNCSAHPASPVAARPTWFWAATASAQRCGRRCGRRGQTLSSSALRRLGGR